MANVGFIGLGIMGKPMALNLIKGGHKLFLHSRSGVAAELTAAGGTACATAADVARQAPAHQVAHMQLGHFAFGKVDGGEALALVQREGGGVARANLEIKQFVQK